MTTRFRRCAWGVGALAVLICAQGAAAQSVADFYKGKTITIVVGSDVAGGYDLTARAIAHYLGRHLPGNPSVIVQNKPGASSLVAANTVYEISPRTAPSSRRCSARFRSRRCSARPASASTCARFQWLGSSTNELGVVVAWHTAPQMSVDDLFSSEMVIGGNGQSTDTELFPRAMNRVLGTKFRIVSGYPGQAQIVLAMQRGEVQGIGNWSFSDIEKGHPDWLRDKSIRLLMQLDLTKGTSPALRDVPLILDVARTEEQRHVFEVLMGMKALGVPTSWRPRCPKKGPRPYGRPSWTPCGIPEFLDEARRTLGPIDPISGADMQRIIGNVYALPPQIIAQAREAVKASGPN